MALELTASATLPGAGVSGTLQLVQISNAAGLSWMAVEATDLNFDLAFGPLTLQVTNGSLIVNQAPLGQTRCTDFTVAAIETLAGVDFTAPTLNGTISLQVSGTASVDLVGLLTVTGGFTLTEFDASTTFAGAGATGLALELTASATLPGAGVSGTLQLVQISNAAGLSWMAVEATDLNFDLAFGPLRCRSPTAV